MKKLITLIASLSLLSSVQGISADSPMKLTQKAAEASEVLDEYMSSIVTSIPISLLERAECILVVPDFVKAGFVFGVQIGKGLASCRTASGWSAPSFTNVRGGGWGFIIGAELTDMVLVFTRPDSARLLQQGNFKISGNAAFAAGPLGRDAQIGTDFLLRSGIYSYSRSKGVYLATSLNGTKLDPSESSNEAFYGQGISATELLTSPALARAKLPAAAETFQGRLEAYSPCH